MDKRDKFPQSAEVEAFKKTILKTAEELVVNKFPKRIVQLNKMLTSGKLTCDPSTVYQKINVPVPDVSVKDLSSKTSQQTASASSTVAQAGSSSNQPESSNGESGVSYHQHLTSSRKLYLLKCTKTVTNHHHLNTCHFYLSINSHPLLSVDLPNALLILMVLLLEQKSSFYQMELYSQISL